MTNWTKIYDFVFPHLHISNGLLTMIIDAEQNYFCYC